MKTGRVFFVFALIVICALNSATAGQFDSLLRWRNVGPYRNQPITVQIDPRVKASAADLQEQFDLSWQLYQLRLKLAPIGKQFGDIGDQLAKLKARAAERPDVTEKLEAFGQILAKFGPPHPRPGAPPSLFVLESTTRLFDETQSADAAPAAAVKAAAADVQAKVETSLELWKKLLEADLPALNQQLKAADFSEIKPAG